MKNKGITITVSFILYLIVAITAIFSKQNQWTGTDAITGFGSLVCIIFVVLSFIEILNARSISRNEKLMWIVGVILLTPIAGLIYILSGRKRILRNEELAKLHHNI